MKFKVPKNVSLEDELFRGFNKKATIITGIITMINIILCIIAYIIFGDTVVLLSTIYIVSTTTLCIGVFTKLENNMSIATYISLMIKFTKEQQVYRKESEFEQCKK